MFIWNRPTANDQPTPERLEVWLLVAGICLCLALLISGMARSKDVVAADPMAKVSR